MAFFSDRYIFKFKEERALPVVFMFSLRSAGDMRINENLKSFLSKVKPKIKNVISAQQIHGAKVGVVEERSPSLFLDCDALITREKRNALAVFTADCLSIFLYDFKKNAIGLIHAGWRSTKEGIVLKTLRLMKKHFATDPAHLYVAFGPAIRKCCYEVGEEFRDYFFKKYIIRKNNRLYFDLVGINYDELVKQGVNKNYIFDCQLCTSCNKEILFSYRRQGIKSGRMVSLAFLI